MSQVRSNNSFLYFAVLICLLAIGLFMFSKSSFFQIENVRITGLDHIAEDEVLNLLGAVKGQNLFLADTKTLAQKIELHPLVNSAKVEKELPGTLVVKVQERLPVALILAKDGMIEVDKQGTLLRFHDTWPAEDCPVLTGIKVPETLGPGQKLDNPELARGLAVIGQAPAALIPQFGEVHISDDGQVFVYLTSGKEIRLGFSEDYSSKLILLQEVLNSEEYKQVEHAVQYVDLTAGKPVLGQ